MASMIMFVLMLKGESLPGYGMDGWPVKLQLASFSKEETWMNKADAELGDTLLNANKLEYSFSLQMLKSFRIHSCKMKTPFQCFCIRRFVYCAIHKDPKRTKTRGV